MTVPDDPSDRPLPGGTDPAGDGRPLLPWRTVRLDDALELRIPGNWIDSQVNAEDGFAQWMARDWHDRDVTLWLRLGELPLEELAFDGDLPPADTAAGAWLLDCIRGREEQLPGRRPISAVSDGDRAVYRVVDPFEPAEGGRFWHHRWYVAERRGDDVLVAILTLTAPAARDGDPALAGLVERFAAELPQIRLLGLPPLPPPPLEPGADPYRNWQTITCYGCIRIRVPTVWTCGYDPDAGMWCGYRPDEREDDNTGVMWLAYNVFADTAGDDRPPFEGVDAAIPVPEDAEDLRCDGAPHDRITRYREFGPENGERLAFVRWVRCLIQGRRLMLLHVSLVFPDRRSGAPDVLRFVEMMDQEVRAADIRIPDY